MKCSYQEALYFLVLTLLFVYTNLIIDVSSAFTEVVTHRATVPTFCRFLQPIFPQRKLQIVKRRRSNGSIEGDSSKYLPPLSSISLPSSPIPIPYTPEYQCEKVELWLDLRETKVAPNVALMHIIQELHEGSPSINDKAGSENTSRSSAGINGDGYDILAEKVLVSMDDDTDRRSSSMIDDDRQRKRQRKEMSKVALNGNIDKAGDASRDPIEIVYALIDNNGNSGKLCCYQRLSEEDEDETVVTIGEVMIISTPSNTNVNPIQALEVVSRGEWVFLDDHKSIKFPSQDTRSEVVQSLVELVSSGACASLPLFNVHCNDANNAKCTEMVHVVDSNVSLGGIAISCRTNADILEIAACIKSLVSVGEGKGYTTTESGIYVQVLPNDNEDPSSTRMATSMPGDDARDKSVKYAIVIPFDTGLWKTAALIFR